MQLAEGWARKVEWMGGQVDSVGELTHAPAEVLPWWEHYSGKGACRCMWKTVQLGARSSNETQRKLERSFMNVVQTADRSVEGRQDLS